MAAQDRPVGARPVGGRPLGARPVGSVTRGTTGTNRLRRCDRWLAGQSALTAALDPLVVDLGFGANAVTTLELERRLRRVRSDVQVVGIEIEPERVAVAREQLRRVRAGATAFDADARVDFAHGGFEVPLPDDRAAAVIRAFNVLRQYNEDDVASAWRRMIGRLQPDGLLVDGTCDEIGRIASWIALTAQGPQSLTLSLRLADLERPSVVAERLPKALIHRNVPGERIHRLMTDLDRMWAAHAPLSAFGPQQRWMATVRSARDEGWRITGSTRRWRLGEVTIAWADVAPVDHTR